MFHSTETDKEYATTDSKEDLVCTICDCACIGQMLVMYSLLTLILGHILCFATSVFTHSFMRNKLSFFNVFQVVLSVFWHKGMFGAAYYTAETSEVWCSVLFFNMKIQIIIIC